MSNGIHEPTKSNNIIKDISDIIVDLNENGLKPTSNNIKDTLEMLMPRDENGNLLTSYTVKDSLFLKSRPGFNPKFNNLIFSNYGMEKWCNEYCKVFLGSDYSLKTNYLEFYNYIYFSMILHELEHSVQYAQAFEDYQCEYSALPKVYREIFNVLTRNTSNWKSMIPFYDSINIIRFFIYKINAYNLLLERNACILQFDNIIKIMENNPHVSEEIMERFCGFYVATLLIGYKKLDESLEYPISHTLKVLRKKRILEQLEFTTDSSLIDQMNYGMPIDKDLYNEIYSYAKENSNNFIKARDKILTLLK